MMDKIFLMRLFQPLVKQNKIYGSHNFVNIYGQSHLVIIALSFCSREL